MAREHWVPWFEILIVLAVVLTLLDVWAIIVPFLGVLP